MRRKCLRTLYNGSFSRRLHAIRSSTDCNNKQAKKRYKVHFDRSVRCQPPFGMKNFVHADRLQLTVTAADGVATESYSKLLPRAFGPFRTAPVGQHTLSIHKDRIPNTISIDCAMLVPNAADPWPPASDSRQREKILLWMQKLNCLIHECSPTLKYSKYTDLYRNKATAPTYPEFTRRCRRTDIVTHQKSTKHQICTSSVGTDVTHLMTP